MHFGVQTHRLDLGGTEQILGQAQVTEQFKTGIVEQAIDTARRGPRRVVQRGKVLGHRLGFIHHEMLVRVVRLCVAGLRGVVRRPQAHVRLVAPQRQREQVDEGLGAPPVCVQTMGLGGRACPRATAACKPCCFWAAKGSNPVRKKSVIAMSRR